MISLKSAASRAYFLRRKLRATFKYAQPSTSIVAAKQTNKQKRSNRLDIAAMITQLNILGLQNSEQNARLAIGRYAI